MRGSRREMPTAHAGTQVVVITYTLFDRTGRFVKDAIDAFGYCILVGVAVLRHANGNLRLTEPLDVGEAAVLTPPVRVVN